MGERGHGLSLKFMRKSRLKRNFKNRKLLNIMVPNFLRTNSILVVVTRATRTQSFRLKKKLRPISLKITYKVNKVGPCTLLRHEELCLINLTS